MAEEFLLHLATRENANMRDPKVLTDEDKNRLVHHLSQLRPSSQNPVAIQPPQVDRRKVFVSDTKCPGHVLRCPSEFFVIPAMPHLLICRYHFEIAVIKTEYAHLFTPTILPEGGPCWYIRPRVQRLLAPPRTPATAADLVSYYAARLNMPECFGLDTTAERRYVLFSYRRHDPSAHVCEACRADYLVGTGLEDFFTPSKDHPYPYLRDTEYCQCHFMSIPAMRRAYERFTRDGDEGAYKAAMDRRFRLEFAYEDGELDAYPGDRFYYPQQPVPGGELVLCAGCYLDYVAGSALRGLFYGKEMEEGGRFKCSVHQHSNFPYAFRVARHTWDINRFRVALELVLRGGPNHDKSNVLFTLEPRRDESAPESPFQVCQACLFVYFSPWGFDAHFSRCPPTPARRGKEREGHYCSARDWDGGEEREAMDRLQEAVVTGRFERFRRWALRTEEEGRAARRAEEREAQRIFRARGWECDCGPCEEWREVEEERRKVESRVAKGREECWFQGDD